jgi:hypothetical protein
MKKIFLLTTIATLLFTVNNFVQAQTLTADAGSNVTICFGHSTALGGAPTANGGTAPYNYSWYPATGFNSDSISNPTASPVVNTTYTVVVTDSLLNTASASVTVSVNPLPVAEAGISRTICNGMSVTLTATGGTTYQWSNGVNSSSFSLSPTSTSTYTVTVSNGSCSATDNVMISVDNFSVIVYTTDEHCGYSDGTATANVSGGIGAYSYRWSTVPSQNSQNAAHLSSGTYTVTVTDGNGCSNTGSGIVSNIPGPNITVSTTPASCGICNGSVIIGASGGTPPFMYSWSNGMISNYSTYLCSGTYNVTVVDANNCANSTSFFINTTNNLTVVPDTLINANCSNNNLGTIAVHGGCGAGNYSYQWSNGATTSMINNLVAGSYSVTVIDANSDTASATFFINNTPNIYAAITAINPNCSNNGSITVYAQGDDPPFTYLWNDPLHQTTATAVGLSQGTYIVTITNSTGCTYIASASLISNCMNVIKGRVYLDANQNCVQDSGEAGIPYRLLYVSPGNYYGSTDTSGNYMIKTYDLNNTLYVAGTLAPYSLICPTAGNYTVNFSNQGDTASGYDFGYYGDPNYFDLVIHPGWSPANPGFNKKYWICYYNNSLTPQNVLIRFVYDSLLQFTSCTQGGVHYPAQHKIEWTINNLQPSSSWNWNTKPDITFYVPTTVSISTILHSYFEILPVTGDAHPSDNTLMVEELVTGSHDPNSKSVSPVGDIKEGYITQNDSVLNYTIHFQNDGNDTAFTVVVIDTLSPFLDPATVVPGAASHPYTFELYGQGILKFRFDNILLPDSNVNEPASNGYVSFSVNQKPNNPGGTVIYNTASNYFDFNEPVNTNTVKNTIRPSLGISDEAIKNGNIIIYPNPFSDVTHIAFTIPFSSFVKIVIYDIYGNTVAIVLDKNMIAGEHEIEFNSLGLSEGIYFLCLETGKQKLTKKMIVY